MRLPVDRFRVHRAYEQALVDGGVLKIMACPAHVFSYLSERLHHAHSLPHVLLCSKGPGAARRDRGAAELLARIDRRVAACDHMQKGLEMLRQIAAMLTSLAKAVSKDT